MKKRRWIIGGVFSIGAMLFAQNVESIMKDLSADAPEPVETVEEVMVPLTTPTPIKPAEVVAPVVADEEELLVGGGEAELATEDSGIISFSFEDRPISEVIVDFALLSGANIITPSLGEEILGKKISINLHFDLADWKSSMQTVLSSQNLELHEEVPGSEVYLIRIKPPQAGVPQKMQTIVLDHADVQGTATAIQGFLGANGSVQPYAAGNALIVQTSAKLLEDVNRIVSTLDVPRQQVLIKARILELTHSGNDDVGVSLDWSNILGEGGTSAANPLEGGLGFDGFGIPATILGSTLTLNSEDLDITLKAIKERGNGKIISTPHVIVANGEPASIEVMTHEPVIQIEPTYGDDGDLQSITYTQEEDGSDPVTGRKRYAANSYGIRLSVTPTVYNEDNIAVKVDPVISRLKEYVIYGLGLGGTNGTIRYPVIDEKKVSTIFMLADGETAVIGGLTETETTEKETRVPLLSSIPLIRHLFISRSAVDVQKENIIFVTVSLEDGKDFDIAGAVKRSPLTRKQLARDAGDQKVQDRDVELVEAAEEARIAEDIKEIERQDQIERREREVRKPFWEILRPDISPRWSPL